MNLLILLGTPKHSADLVGLTSSVGTRTSTSVVQWYPGDNGLFVSSGADGQLKVWDANVLSTPVETFALGKRIYCHHISGINPSCVAVGTETNHVRIGTHHTVRKSQIVSENSIFRKIQKFRI